MYIWAVWHDRPLCWACEREHYHTLFRPRQLPSVSQFCRRVKDDPRFTLTLQYLHEQLADCDTPSLLGCFDGKLMPVALHKLPDPDAKKVRTNGGYVRGYRLHAWTDRGRIRVWCVTAANEGEQTIARALCQYLPTLSPGVTDPGRRALRLGLPVRTGATGDIRPTTDADAKHRTHTPAPPRDQTCQT